MPIACADTPREGEGLQREKLRRPALRSGSWVSNDRIQINCTVYVNDLLSYDLIANNEYINTSTLTTLEDTGIQVTQRKH